MPPVPVACPCTPYRVALPVAAFAVPKTPVAPDAVAEFVPVAAGVAAEVLVNAPVAANATVGTATMIATTATHTIVVS
jgi:hypothetical protein